MGVEDDDDDLLLLALLPEDTLTQILARLPVKSLLRFKSVCKFWHSLIRSTFFMHLHTATNTNFNSKFGTFILHASGPVDHHHHRVLRENTILMLSSGSESESEFESKSKSSSGYGGWCWSTGNDTDGLREKFNTWRSLGGYNSYFAFQDKYDDDEEKVFKVFSNGDQDQHQDQVVFKLDNLGIPLCYKFYNDPKYIVGSCNGIICLYDRKQMDVSLWNPATRQFRILPKWITIALGHGVEIIALGFDVETKDYKVMVVICTRPFFGQEEYREYLCRVQVYSLSTDSWRLLEGINSLPGAPMHHGNDSYGSVYMNGNYLFMANVFVDKPWSKFGSRFIISFDFTKEIFTTMQFPDYDEKQGLVLSSLGEKLALFSVCSQSPIVYPMGLVVEDYDIWVLNEHGGSGSGSGSKESWTKLHSFQTITEGECTIPLGISNDGEFALLELQGRSGLSKKMQLYNLVTKEVEKDFLYCSAVFSKAIVYKPSLVSIIGGEMM